MNQSEANKPQGLKDAFLVFNQVSEQLASSYQFLEDRIGVLTEELAAARSERLLQLTEKERLANRLEHLLDALPAGVVVLDGEGCIQQCNPQAVELMGETLLGCAWIDVIERAFVSNNNMTGDEVSLNDGRIVSVSTNPVGDEPGQIILIKDVTETKALQELLNRHQRLSAMGEMTASLAHQIRTPLASCLLYISHLTQLNISREEHNRCVEKIAARLKHLDQLVIDMMAFARGGRMGDEEILVSELLQEVKQVFEAQLVKYPCQFDIINYSQDSILTGNRVALAGVLQNLLVNAIHACISDSTDTVSKIKLEVTTVGALGGIEAIEFLISDNGSGIPQDQHDKIFEPFYTTKPDGTGLGLAVAQAVIDAHNGSMWLDDKTTRGTKIGIRLPVSGNN